MKMYGQQKRLHLCDDPEIGFGMGAGQSPFKRKESKSVIGGTRRPMRNPALLLKDLHDHAVVQHLRAGPQGQRELGHDALQGAHVAICNMVQGGRSFFFFTGVRQGRPGSRGLSHDPR